MVFDWLVFRYLLGYFTPPQQLESATILQKLYANLLSIGAALARCTPLSTELDRPFYKNLVILDNPFCMRFPPYLTVLLMYPMHTLTAQQ